MKFQLIMLKVYPAILRRIRSWGLVLLLFMLYLSAFCVRNYEITELVSHIGLSSFHVFCGFLLIVVSIVLTYDFIIGRLGLSKAKGRPRSKLSIILPGGLRDNSILIDRLFYFFIFLMCFFGLLLHFVKRTSFNSFLINEIIVQIMHETIGWLFISVIFIRYYRLTVRWFGEIKRYLREV